MAFVDVNVSHFNAILMNILKTCDGRFCDLNFCHYQTANFIEGTFKSCKTKCQNGCTKPNASWKLKTKERASMTLDPIKAAKRTRTKRIR